MCIIFIAIEQHPNYPLIIAANRDEFYQRPTQASHWWPDPPSILAGKDLQAGGSWMGVTRSGKIAALTNIRNPAMEQTNVRSRGELVINYLSQQSSLQTFTAQLQQQRSVYNGFNLLFGRLTSLHVYNNHSNTLSQLSPGFHGVSNASLNTPWPKVTRGVTALQDYVLQHNTLDANTLFLLLQDTTPAAKEMLPDTGVPLEWEQRLSPIFIRSPDYGTRSSTLLVVDNQNRVRWIEREYLATTQGFTTTEFNWQITTE